MKSKHIRPWGFSFLRFFLWLLLIGIGSVFLFLTFFLSPTAKWAVHKYLPEVLGTEVELGKIDVRLWSTSIELENFRIGDPSGDVTAPDLLSVERLAISVERSSLFGDAIVIKSVDVVRPNAHLTLDKDGTFSFENLKVLKELEKDETETVQPDEKDSKGRAIVINKISIEDLGFTYHDEGTPGKIVDIVLKNFTFKGEDLHINPKGWVEDLSKGVEIASLQFSDAKLSYNSTAVEGYQVPEAVPEVTLKQKEPALPDEKDKQQEVLQMEAEIDPIRIHKIDLKNFSLAYTDNSDPAKPLNVAVEKLYVDLSDFSMHTTEKENEQHWKPTLVQTGFKVNQGVDRMPAYFDAFAKLDLAGEGIPTTTGVFRLTGFKFETISPLIPQGTETAIGGSAFDLSTVWSISADLLDVAIVLISNRGTQTTATIGGTPQSPQFRGSELLLNIAGRPAQFITGLTGDVFDGGMDLLSGATDTAGELARGAGRSVMGFGSGLLNTGRGLITGDLDSIEKGLKEATVGTVGNVAGTVSGTTSTARDSVGRAVDTSTGGGRTSSWRDSITKRHDIFLAEGKEWLKTSPFPPGEEQALEKATKLKEAEDFVEKPIDTVKATDSDNK